MNGWTYPGWMQGSDNEAIRDDDLGDASEVYEVEPTANSDFRMSGESFDAYAEEIQARWRVDEIYGGSVYLAGFWKGESRKASTGARLDPDSARQLGQALIRAAEYADRQAADGTEGSE
ncbi:hypothetical protein C437_15346 [Haloarcula vallismortis ATCC 29715]|uniref:Uncharacterized protein n=1 Tax=Haloarcula vallismortis ATCC 29715 TaxID=662477 RepID=M0IY67_HALVA|nr:hypothetical protein [Haloarcula vallismortis]EMA01807.1 hypothetical protein C437_15346 [Haloarcula vallismortis ATCC 29715]